MNPNEMTIGQEIEQRSRIRDELPERIPTTLARELINSYPGEVKAHPDRLASLAGDIIRRERNERLHEADRLRGRIRGLEAELTEARRLAQRYAGDVHRFQDRLQQIAELARRSAGCTRPSKGRRLVRQIWSIAIAALPSSKQEPFRI